MQTMEITEIYSHTLWQKFRESNSFTKWVTTELISRKKFGESKFLVFSHCVIFTWAKNEKQENTSLPRSYSPHSSAQYAIDESPIISATFSGIGTILRFMAKNKGNERAMEMLQMITKEAMAVDNFWGVRFVAEYTITLYLIVAKKRGY